GVSVPLVRMLEEHIGVLGYCGLMYLSIGVLGCAAHKLRRPPWRAAIFLSPYFYARGLSFVLHDALQLTAILLVQKQHLDFVILLNYLWPTAVIICSVLIAGVRITRWW